MIRLLKFLNPIAHLGETNYSPFFPLIANVLLIFFSEFFAVAVFNDPSLVGRYIIFLNVAFIIYFAFRSGLQGGYIAVTTAIAYYFYIIYSRNYEGEQLNSSITVTLILAILYLVLASIIGWLKQTIDELIERQADERIRLETILQQLPVGVLVTDQTGKLTQRNRQADHILGFKLPIGFEFGKDTLQSEKIDGEPITPSQSPLLQALRTGKMVTNREFAYQDRTGKKSTLLVSSAPILNSAKKIIAAASIIGDITPQKELERQKDEFLSIASHELKTPITSIKAYGQVLRKSFENKGEDQAVEQLTKMDAQINKLTNLVGDLLDVTRIQSGRLEFHPQDVACNHLVSEIVEELKLTTSSHKIEIILGKNKTIYVDKERIGQVIINLITNAVKYSPEAKKIVVKTQSKPDEVIISVRDFGIGIPVDMQNKVFERFYRVNGDQQHVFPGLGLGLYISSEIVKRTGGKIWLESETNKGTTFYISFPVKKTMRKK